MTNEAAMWGIHGGATGDADTLFLKKNVMASGRRLERDHRGS